MEEFNKAYKGLNSDQKKAVDQLDGPVLVIAGPGTGKTHLLTTRVANILNRTDTLPENILCLTFTDAAAHTMRDRLTNVLGQRAYDVTISTYHGFGSDIIRRYRDYFSDSKLENPIDELRIDAFLREIIDQLQYDNPLRSDYFLRDVKTLISDCKRALINPTDLTEIAKSNALFYEKVQPSLDSLFANFKRIDKNSINIFEQLVKSTSKIKQKSPKKNIKSINELWQSSLEEAIERFNEDKKTSHLTIWKDAWLTKNDQGNFVPMEKRNIIKLFAFAEIYQKYQDLISEQNVYDYDDMISRAIVGLQKNPDLRYSLQEKYQYILLDEFQDTNGAQLRLIELLTDNPVHEGRPNILAVGDDDQAIYAFQGADYSNMQTFYNLFRNVEVVTLHQNYRSTDQIVNFTSKISEQITDRLRKQFSQLDDLTSSQKSTDLIGVIARNEFKSDVAQYAWVANKISALVKDGTPASQIAVLAPQHRYLEPLVPYLHHGGLSVHYEKRENVLDDKLITYLVLMSKLILSLSKNDFALSNSLWIEILSADFWGIKTEALWRLSWQAHEEKKNWTNILIDNPITADITLFFVKLASLAPHETLENMFDYLIGVSQLLVDQETDKHLQSPIYEYYFSQKTSKEGSSEFWQLLSNLTVLRQHLREFQNSETSPLILYDFVSFVDAHRRANINIINTSPYFEATEAVQLMTAYKSKGQEFKIVFVLGCLEEVWGNTARRLSSSLGLPANLAFIRYAGSTTDEQLRLFYVALSRAKFQLYLTSYLSTYTNKPLTHLKFLSETIAEDGQIFSPLLAPPEQLVQQTDTTAPELATLELYWHSRHHDIDDRADLKALVMPRLQYFQLSPSHLNQFVDVLTGGPYSFFLNTLLRFPRATKPSAQYGNAVHETLQWIHIYNREKNHLPNEKAVFQKFDEQLSRKFLLPSQIKLLTKRGQHSLSSYLQQRVGTINANNEVEFNFRREGVFVNGAHLTGNIDKLIIDRAKKKITVVDYKTGRSHKKWASDLVLHKYKKQLYFYKFLVENSHTYSGYQVDDAYLEFVEPDQDGRLNELHLVFDPIEEKQLKNLISGVWQHILRLDFPDITDFPQSYRGIVAFETYLSSRDSPK